MVILTNRKRWLILLGIFAFLISCSRLTYFILARSSQSLHYPGAALISQHTIRDLFPNPTFKQSYSFITEDTYPDVAYWYTTRFGLGTERQAQDRCSHYYNSQPVLLSTQTTSLTLCDTTEGRMIFVQQTVLVNWRIMVGKRP